MAIRCIWGVVKSISMCHTHWLERERLERCAHLYLFLFPLREWPLPTTLASPYSFCLSHLFGLSQLLLAPLTPLPSGSHVIPNIFSIICHTLSRLPLQYQFRGRFKNSHTLKSRKLQRCYTPYTQALNHVIQIYYNYNFNMLRDTNFFMKTDNIVENILNNDFEALNLIFIIFISL